MTIVKSSNNGIEVRSKCIGKVGGSKMNDTNDNIVSKSNIINGKVNRNNYFMYNIKNKFYILVQLKIPFCPFHVSIKLKCI